MRRSSRACPRRAHSGGTAYGRRSGVILWYHLVERCLDQRGHAGNNEYGRCTVLDQSFRELRAEDSADDDCQPVSDDHPE